MVRGHCETRRNESEVTYELGQLQQLPSARPATESMDLVVGSLPICTSVFVTVVNLLYSASLLYLIYLFWKQSDITSVETIFTMLGISHVITILVFIMKRDSTSAKYAALKNVTLIVTGFFPIVTMFESPLNLLQGEGKAGRELRRDTLAFSRKKIKEVYIYALIQFSVIGVSSVLLGIIKFTHYESWNPFVNQELWPYVVLMSSSAATVVLVTTLKPILVMIPGAATRCELFVYYLTKFLWVAFATGERIIVLMVFSAAFNYYMLSFAFLHYYLMIFANAFGEYILAVSSENQFLILCAFMILSQLVPVSDSKEINKMLWYMVITWITEMAIMVAAIVDFVRDDYEKLWEHIWLRNFIIAFLCYVICANIFMILHWKIARYIFEKRQRDGNTVTLEMVTLSPYSECRDSENGARSS